MSFIETLVILLVAVIVFGPKRLPEVARKIGKVTGALRRAGDEFRRQLMSMDQAVETHVSNVTRDLDTLAPDEDEAASFARAAGYDPSQPPAFAPYVPDGSIAGNGGPDIPLTATPEGLSAPAGAPAAPEPSAPVAAESSAVPSEAPGDGPEKPAASAPPAPSVAAPPSASAESVASASDDPAPREVRHG